MKFDRVMVPVDGSVLSEIAVDLALNSAEYFATHLTFVYVLDATSVDSFGEVDPNIKHMKMRMEGKSALKTAAKLANEYGIDHETILAEGIPWEVLSEMSKDQDMIIMAVTGKSGLGAGRIGVTTRKVVENSYCPILTLKSGSNRIKEILLPVSNHHMAAIDVAIETAKRTGSNITVLSVRGHGYDADSLVDEVSKRCIDAKVSVSTKVGEGDPVESIVGLSGLYDLVIMGVEKRGGLQQILNGGITERVVANAACPVTVVRDNS